MGEEARGRQGNPIFGTTQFPNAEGGEGYRKANERRGEWKK